MLQNDEGRCISPAWGGANDDMQMAYPQYTCWLSCGLIPQYTFSYFLNYSYKFVELFMHIPHNFELLAPPGGAYASPCVIWQHEMSGVGNFAPRGRAALPS